MDRKLGKIQSLLNAQIGKGGVHNIVTAVQSYDKSLDFVGAAGVADPVSGVSMTPETPYFIASVTKMYTAAIAMQLHTEKKLDLEAPISSYLPSSLVDGIHAYKGIDYSRQIKVYQLINQTSVLADYEMENPRGERVFSRNCGLVTTAPSISRRRFELPVRCLPTSPRESQARHITLISITASWGKSFSSSRENSWKSISRNGSARPWG